MPSCVLLIFWLRIVVVHVLHFFFYLAVPLVCLLCVLDGIVSAMSAIARRSIPCGYGGLDAKTVEMPMIEAKRDLRCKGKHGTDCA